MSFFAAVALGLLQNFHECLHTAGQLTDKGINLHNDGVTKLPNNYCPEQNLSTLTSTSHSSSNLATPPPPLSKLKGPRQLSLF